MANWRQVQARIRKAKNAPDAVQKLTELFEKTRDGMVAFELATLQEKQGNSDEAVRWLTSAAEHFRRSDWKNKVAEALTRLGAAVPASLLTADASGAARPAAEKSETPRRTSDDPASLPPLAAGEIVESAEETEEEDEETANAPTSAAANTAGTAATDGAAASGKRRRRGRRGGRGRRKKGAAAQAPGLPSQSFARSTPSQTSRIEPAPTIAIPSPALDRRAASSDRIEHASARAAWVRPEPEIAPLMPSERGSGRAGEPALASRLAHLENTLRRLVSSPLHKLEEADEAPAGPGVFLVSDSDLVTSYYIEACQTLRIGLGHLLRGGRGPRTHPDGTLRSRLAEHLGISESKVGDYMKKYCVVRWIQLDDAAPHFAHFAIGVLRTPLNSD
jgi:hypothetical protein